MGIRLDATHSPSFPSSALFWCLENCNKLALKTLVRTHREVKTKENEKHVEENV